MNKLKIISAALMALNVGVGYGASPLDGIYNCNLVNATQNAASGNGIVTFFSINSNASTTVVAIPNMGNILFDGYIIGAPATEAQFIGTTDLGNNFTITATGAVGSKELTLNGSLHTKNGIISGKGTCKQLL